MLEVFTHNGMPQIFGAIGAPVLVFLVLLFVDPPMAMATMASVAAGIPVFGWTDSVFKSMALRRQDLQAEATSRMLEYLQGISVVRAFNQSGERLRRFRDALDDFRRMNLLLAVRLAPLGSAFMAVVELGVPLVIASGTYWLLGGRLDAGSLLVFLVLVLRVYQPVLQVAVQMESLRLADASLERLARVADAPSRPEPLVRPSLERFDVTFEHVDFGYEQGTRAARRELHRPARQHDGDRRSVRLGKDDRSQPGRALLGRRLGRGADRRTRCPRSRDRADLRRDQRCLSGRVPLPGAAAPLARRRRHEPTRRTRSFNRGGASRPPRGRGPAGRPLRGARRDDPGTTRATRREASRPEGA